MRVFFENFTDFLSMHQGVKHKFVLIIDEFDGIPQIVVCDFLHSLTVHLINQFYRNNGRGDPVPTMRMINDILTTGFMRQAVVIFTIPMMIKDVSIVLVLLV